MGQALEEFVKARVDSEDRRINMTIQLSHVENEMVKFWARKFGMSKRKFLADLVMAAIKDVEKVCPLSREEEDEYEQIVMEASMEGYPVEEMDDEN